MKVKRTEVSMFSGGEVSGVAGRDIGDEVTQLATTEGEIYDIGLSMGFGLFADQRSSFSVEVGVRHRGLYEMIDIAKNTSLLIGYHLMLAYFAGGPETNDKNVISDDTYGIRFFAAPNIINSIMVSDGVEIALGLSPGVIAELSRHTIENFKREKSSNDKWSFRAAIEGSVELMIRDTGSAGVFGRMDHQLDWIAGIVQHLSF